MSHLKAMQKAPQESGVEKSRLGLSLPEKNLKPCIMVMGVGGAGGNAVHNMIESGLEGVHFMLANTDAQAMQQNECEHRIQIGMELTEGLGAGSRPDVGQAAAEEATDEIVEALQGAHMVFVTAGMGGGTGTGASPVIARLAKELDILTVGVVTKPFDFEGKRRMEVACEGLRQLQEYVDTLLVIPNQNLFRLAKEDTTFAEAFAMADRVLYAGVAGITNLMVKPGLINLDFADVRSVMNGMGHGMMGTGEASGQNRAQEAAEAAIANPLLDDVSMKGAKGLLISIVGGSDLTLYEVDEAAQRIRGEVDPSANIIVGSTFDDSLEGAIRISLVATGIDGQESKMARRGLTILEGGFSKQNEATPRSAAPEAQGLAGEHYPREEAQVTISPVPHEHPGQARPLGGGSSFLGRMKQWFVGSEPPPPEHLRRMRVMPMSGQVPTAPKRRDDQLEIPAFLRRGN